MKPSSSYNFLTTETMSNVYDVEDLKAQIRQLRSTRSALQQESEVLEKEIASLQEKADAIKQQLSIESVNDELRMIGSDVLNDPVNDESADDSVDVRRFKLLNDKMDKQILNQDTRQHLPQLEALALTWEKTMWDAQKIAKRNEREQTLFPQYSENLQKLSVVKAQAAREAEAQRGRKVPLCQEINLLRRQINALYEEKESLAPVVIRSEIAYFKELSRIKFLKKEHVRVRELLSSFHSKFVWQTEAFLKHMKSLDSRMPISLVPTAVVPWICFRFDASPRRPILETEADIPVMIRRLENSAA
eukprot:gene26854-35546_t